MRDLFMLAIHLLVTLVNGVRAVAGVSLLLRLAAYPQSLPPSRPAHNHARIARLCSANIHVAELHLRLADKRLRARRCRREPVLLMPAGQD